VYCFGEAQEIDNQYIEIFGCKSRDFPILCLGISIHFRKLRDLYSKKVKEHLEMMFEQLETN
jgi:hypothetical protein